MKEQKGSEKQGEFVLKALTHKQLAQMYGVSWLTFQNWMKKVENEVGKKTGHFYHVHQVKKYFKSSACGSNSVWLDMDENP